MRVIALTGGIGSGKSLAAQYFAELGALVIDADQLARDVISRGTEGFDEVVSYFGDSILKDGDIDRRALGELVFNDSKAMAVLEGIVHPRVTAEFNEAVQSLSGDQILIYEIPLLFEKKAHDRFDSVITVEADMEQRIERLRAKGLHMSEINSRIAAQATREQRVSVADYVLENSGSQD
ncbi:MAG: dephospho-CoA kinase, partial [Actinobacteria bacterium]|nr:dephospho-CoA kinase [Actinomycetota bacterium]